MLLQAVPYCKTMLGCSERHVKWQREAASCSDKLYSITCHPRIDGILFVSPWVRKLIALPVCFRQVTHMPPELLSEGKLSQKADLYAFGIILWEM